MQHLQPKCVHLKEGGRRGGLSWNKKNVSINDAYAQVKRAVYFISHSVPQPSQDISKGIVFKGILKDEKKALAAFMYLEQVLCSG